MRGPVRSTITKPNPVPGASQPFGDTTGLRHMQPESAKGARPNIATLDLMMRQAEVADCEQTVRQGIETATLRNTIGTDTRT